MSDQHSFYSKISTLPPPPPPFPKWARIDYRYLKRKTFWRNEYGVFKDSAHKYNVNTVILSVIAACINKQTRHENTASDTVRLISWHLSLIPGIYCIKEQNQLELKTVKKKKKRKRKRKTKKVTLISPGLIHLCN